MEGTKASTISCEFIPQSSLASLTLFFRGADKSSRYVAEENIIPLDETPSESLMKLAGRHFKRWDEQTKMFVSNITDEYPDD